MSVGMSPQEYAKLKPWMQEQKTGEEYSFSKESNMDAQQATMPQPMVGRDPEMKIALSALGVEVEMLQEEVGILVSRLNAVMNAGSPSINEAPPDIQSMEAEYPDKVNKFAYAIADQRRQLQSILRRLEI